MIILECSFNEQLGVKSGSSVGKLRSENFFGGSRDDAAELPLFLG
ncbi:MAG: hypothetical protein VX016_08895 [Verrucomicrobiota bacterium]|nr:hypothetical protein [Verrucomicrobiota bacterium]MEC8691663.1 hypothetical protein [Verrucomicrobiota bacterium]